MPVSFVIGRAGSGKTERLVRKLIASVRQDPLGPPLLWIVPKQSTFSAERELTCRLGAFSRVRVLSFDQLAKLIRESCGEPAIPEVTELGRRLIIGHLLRLNQPRLRYFGGVASRPGLAAELDATFSEIDRSGQSSADFTAFAATLGSGEAAADGSGLGDKVHDLALLHDAYSRYLGQERLDQHRRMEQACRQIEQCPLLQNAFACVDGFLQFSNHERRILVGLAKACRGVEINLLLDPACPLLRDPHRMPDELGLFHRTEITYRKLWFALREEHIPIGEAVRLWEPRRFSDADLIDLEHRLFEAERATEDAEADGPSLFAAPAARRSARRVDERSLRDPESPRALPPQSRAVQSSRYGSSLAPVPGGEGGGEGLGQARAKPQQSLSPWYGGEGCGSGSIGPADENDAVHAGKSGSGEGSLAAERARLPEIPRRSAPRDDNGHAVRDRSASDGTTSTLGPNGTASSPSPGTPGEGGVRAGPGSRTTAVEPNGPDLLRDRSPAVVEASGPHPASPGVPGEGFGLCADKPVENSGALSAIPGMAGYESPQDVPASSARVALIEAPDPRSEIDAVAREILSLLRRGSRLRDILVLARDLSPYHDLIAASFREHGIPYFVDRRRPAGHHPLLGFVRSALRIARVGWPLQTVLDFLRTGLAGVSPQDADDVENYLLRHRLANVAWDDSAEWRYVAPYSADPAAPSRTTERIRREVARRLVPLIDRVRSPERSMVRDYAAEVFTLLEAFGVRSTLSRWMDKAQERGDLELRGEHEQAWAALVDLFEQMVDLLGDEPVTPADFADVLESGLEQFDFALTPPTVDQVLVGEVERTRTAAARATFVIGLNEGQFPKTAQDHSVLTGADRRELARRKLDLDADPTRRQLDERLLAYLAFTRASERLILTRPTADAAGRKTAASAFWHEVDRLVPAAHRVRVPRSSDDDPAAIATPAGLIASLMRWARRAEGEIGRGGEGENAAAVVEEAQRGAAIGADTSRTYPSGTESAVSLSPPLPISPSLTRSLYSWLRARPVDGDEAAKLRYRAWRALSYWNAATISPDVAGKLFGSPLRASAAQLEAQAACPFRHFVKYGLGLQGRQGHELSAVDMSRMYHDVLNDVLAEVVAGGSKLRDLSPPAAAELIRRFAGAVAERLRGEVMLESARNQYLLSRIERTIQQVVASLREMLGRGAFDARQPSVAFGDGGKLPACVVKTPSGRELRLSGRIDRIDVVPDGPHAGATAVFDYKLGKEALDLGDVYHGLSLQLLAGLMALESVGQTLTGREPKPAAAFYCQLSRGLQQVDHPDEAADPSSAEFHLRHKPRGVFDGKFFESIDAQAQNNDWSKVVQVHLKVDGSFGHRAKSDVADSGDFTTLLSFVRGRMGQMADEIMNGKIDVSPYRIGQKSPCPHCEYRPICRFEPAAGGYRFLPAMNRVQVLDTICGRT